jgi:hypothetical protein
MAIPSSLKVKISLKQGSHATLLATFNQMGQAEAAA